MTAEKLPRSEDSLTIFHELSSLLPESQLSELLSTLGRGGKGSRMDMQDTLMLWFATLLQKDRESLLTEIRALLTPLTQLGTPSPDSN